MCCGRPVAVERVRRLEYCLMLSDIVRWTIVMLMTVWVICLIVHTAMRDQDNERGQP